MRNLEGSPGGASPLVITNVAALGDTTLVPATAGKVTRVYSLRLSVAGATIVTLKNGAVPLEVFNFAAAGGSVNLVLRDETYYTTGLNTALILNSTVAVQVDGRMEYVTTTASIGV